jgi:integrase
MPLTTYKRGRFWWLTGTIRNHEGEQRVHESTGETDEAAADDVRLEREKEAKRDRELGAKGRYLFSEAVSYYLDAGKPEAFIPPLLDKFRDTRVADMSGELVRAAARELYPKAAYTTWNRQVVTPVKAIINLSADAGRCPAVKIKGFSKRDRNVRRPSTPPKRAVDRSYIDAFRAHCDDPRLSAMVLFMFQTGARVSDAIGLEEGSEDLDLVNRTVIIRDTKNGEDREADITIEMVYELQQLAVWKAERAEAGDYGRGARKPNTRLFGFMARWSVYKDIKAVCARAGIPYLGTHQPGRHSFATEMIVKNRVDVATTGLKGGWKSKQLLMSTYAHGDTGKGVIDRVFGMKRKKA